MNTITIEAFAQEVLKVIREGVSCLRKREEEEKREEEVEVEVEVLNQMPQATDRSIPTLKPLSHTQQLQRAANSEPGQLFQDANIQRLYSHAVQGEKIRQATDTLTNPRPQSPDGSIDAVSMSSIFTEKDIGRLDKSSGDTQQAENKFIGDSKTSER